MTTTRLENISIATCANVFFDGRCISHTVESADGQRKSVGVILPAILNFDTVALEIMECVAGSCRVRLRGASAWQQYGPGESFAVPANSGFEIEVSGEPYHYICHFG